MAAIANWLDSHSKVGYAHHNCLYTCHEWNVWKFKWQAMCETINCPQS